MKIKISATYEGHCMICKKEKVVFSAGDEDTKKVVTICGDCAKELGDVQTSDVIEKYGKKDDSAFKGGGIDVMGLDKLQSKLEEKKEKAAAKNKTPPT